MSGQSGVRVRVGVQLFLLSIIFFLTGAGTVWAACAGDAPVPPEGFAWPVKADISQPWTLDCRSSKGHRGIDITVGPGDAISAAASGTVSFVGYTPAEGGGITVTVDHAGGLRTTYLHLQSALVSKSQNVSQGQQLGISNGSPLHFGVKDAVADVYYDPTSLLPPLPPEPAGDVAPQPQADEVPAPVAPAPGTVEEAGATTPEPAGETSVPMESPVTVEPLPAPVEVTETPAAPLEIADPPAAPVAVTEPVPVEPLPAPISVAAPMPVPDADALPAPAPVVVKEQRPVVGAEVASPAPAAASVGDPSPVAAETSSGWVPAPSTQAASSSGLQIPSSEEIAPAAHISAATAAVPPLPPDPVEPALAEEWWWEEQPEEDEEEPLSVTHPLPDPWPLVRPQPRLLLAGRETPSTPIPRLEWATISGRDHPVKHLWGAAVLVAASLVLTLAAALMHRGPLLAHMGLRELYSPSGTRNARL
jgi:hypothetical protein